MYEEAVASWEKVRDTYYSPEMNALAEFKIAEAYFLAEQYVEAAASFEDFLKQHPTHSRTQEALYYLGRSYYNQILSPDRDQTATRNALVTFETFLRRYPQAKERGEIQTFIDHCRERLAEQQFAVGEFYLRTHHPEAAADRFKDLLRDFPETRDRDRVWFHLGKAYLRAGQRQEAVTAFNTLYRDFPGSEYVQRAQKFLEKNY
jgi:outer membrane protein assembly factor BamD